MIKPSDLPSITQDDTVAQAAIESHLDEAIRRYHAAKRSWPLVVPTTRTGWSELDIEAVLARYRAAGWEVMSGGEKALAILSPSQYATANQRDEDFDAALRQRATGEPYPVESEDPQAEVVAAAAANPGKLIIGGRGNGPIVIGGRS